MSYRAQLLQFSSGELDNVFAEMVLEGLDGRAWARAVLKTAYRLNTLVWIGRAPRWKIAAMLTLVCLGATRKCKGGFCLDVPCVDLLAWVSPIVVKHSGSRAPGQENQA